MFLDFFETRPLGNHRNVPVHFPIHFNALNDLETVRFESAIKIMEISYAGQTPGRCIEQLGGQGLGKGVVSLFLPAGQYVALTVIQSGQPSSGGSPDGRRRTSNAIGDSSWSLASSNLGSTTPPAVPPPTLSHSTSGSGILNSSMAAASMRSSLPPSTPTGAKGSITAPQPANVREKF